MAKTAAFLIAIVAIVSLGLLMHDSDSTLAQSTSIAIATATSTPKASPTATAKPTPTATAKPTPTATAKPTPTATATPKADKGCTPGFWKNHPSAWPTAYSPSATVGSVFSGASVFPNLAGATLIQGLAFQGGPGTAGAAEILLRAAIAALLNSASFGPGYPYSTSGVISMTNTALGADRGAMISLASNFDAANNLGCPLN